MSKIGKELAKDAKINGICKDWYKDLKTTDDIDQLLDMYLRGIDFCLSNDYPTNDYIRANFKGKMEHKGIYLDDQLLAVNARKVVALGRCTGSIEVDEFNVCEVFIKHESEATVTAEGNSFVMIDMFDNSSLSVIAHDQAKVCVNHYGGEIIFRKEGKGVVKIIEKNKKTY